MLLVFQMKIISVKFRFHGTILVYSNLYCKTSVEGPSMRASGSIVHDTDPYWIGSDAAARDRHARRRDDR